MLGVELRHMDVVLAVLKRTDRLKKALLKGAADAHDFTGRLHLRGKLIHGSREFIKRESRHLRYDIVESRFEARRRIGKLDLVEVHADGDLCGNTRDRITAGFRCQCGRTGYTGVDLDDVVLKGMRIKRELAVTSAFYAERTDDLQGTVTEHVVLLIRQCLRRRDDDGVTSVDADGVKVFHITNRDRRIVGVADDFVFDLLIALDALFHEDLMHRR